MEGERGTGRRVLVAMGGGILVNWRGWRRRELGVDAGEPWEEVREAPREGELGE